jgi:hypothetical protein
MRKLITLALVAASPVLFAADGNSDSATAKAKVQIVAPVKIVSSGEINFGQIVVDDVTQQAKVTMKVDTAPDGNTSATLTGWDKCAQYKKNNVTVSGAQFHYTQDIQTAVAANVKITVDSSVTLTGGIGGAVTLATNNDLPAEGCSLGDIKGQKEITNYVQFKHFGVGGTLTIPAGALGYKEGTLTVMVEYI